MEPVAVVESELMIGSSHAPIVRTTLRQVLLEGLEDVVQFHKEFVRYESASGSRVRAVFADRTAAIGDVLVGADGSRSSVRRQYLPHARVDDTGIVGAACRLPIASGTPDHRPEHLDARLTSILPDTRTYMIVT